jgi:hypothetical protein
MGRVSRRLLVTSIFVAVASSAGVAAVAVAVPSPGDDSREKHEDKQARPEVAVPEPVEPPPVVVESIAPSPPSFSPLSPSVLEHLREIRARAPERDDRVFMKLGDSHTVSRLYLHCLGEDGVDLAGNDHLADTLAFFREGLDGRRDPFRRESRAAGVGWSVNRVIGSALRDEIRETDPRFATVLFGTNDVQGEMPAKYWARMSVLLDELESEGVIPVLSSIPPRSSRDANQWVRRFNLVVEALARDRRLPLYDLHGDLAGLPGAGMSRDGVHSSVEYSGRMPAACRFDESGLRYGFNVRNLRTLELLDRLRETVVDGRPSPDAEPAPERRGRGSNAEPVELLEVPIAVGNRWPDGETAAHHVFELRDRANVWVAAGSAEGRPLPVRIERDGAPPLERRRWIDETLGPGRYRVVVEARDEGDEYVLIIDRDLPPSVSENPF